MVGVNSLLVFEVSVTSFVVSGLQTNKKGTESIGNIDGLTILTVII